MVRMLMVFFGLMFFTHLFAQDERNVIVEAQVDSDSAYANQPLVGMVTITHEAKDEVDASSFNLENKPLQTDLVKTVRFSPTASTLVSIYRFELPGQPAGIYTLPSIKVKIADKNYQSVPSTYQIKPATEEPVSTEKTRAQLLLKAVVEAPSRIYPGQIVTMIYYFYFKGKIALTEEKLPLLELDDFIKIGDKTIKEYEKDGFSVQEISQKFQAQKAGDFNIPGSYVEGFLYKETDSGKKLFIQPKMRAETTPITLKIENFPTENKPVDFDGAIGKFSFSATLMGSSKIKMEDKLELALDISGNPDELRSVSKPNLANLRQFFRIGDLPDVEMPNKNTKRFKVTLYPLSSKVKEIPAISFSYFDPNTVKYVSLLSEPIPISVEQPATQAPPSIPVATPSELQPVISSPKKTINNIYLLSATDLNNKWFGSWKILWIIPFGILFILLEIVALNRYKTRKDRIKAEDSTKLFQQALQTKDQPPIFYSLLTKALIQRLIEKGIRVPNDIDPEKLPSEGYSGSVKNFLCELEEVRFGKKTKGLDDIITEAKSLWSKNGD